jgi:CheY-like chemotaxis protein
MPAGAAGLRILLAEDNPINQKLAVTLLAKAGYRVRVADTGRQAVEALRDGEKFDLILMDMQMPDMDGLEATRQIRGDEAANGRRRLPIVALTGNAYAADRERCLAAGMDDFLTKPLRRDKLLETIQRHGETGIAGDR